MKFLTKSNEFVEELREISPEKIAVAYIGIDWKEFISVDSLKEIIVYPTLGTNPVAIMEIVGKIGWENVHFLDNLHSKIYIGDSSMLAGSANLSRNALANTGLYEACVSTNEEKLVRSAKEVFDFYKMEAKTKYNEEQKKERLEKLRRIHNRAIRKKIIPPDPIRIRSIKELTSLGCMSVKFVKIAVMTLPLSMSQ